MTTGYFLPSKSLNMDPSTFLGSRWAMFWYMYWIVGGSCKIRYCKCFFPGNVWIHRSCRFGFISSCKDPLVFVWCSWRFLELSSQCCGYITRPHPSAVLFYRSTLKIVTINTLMYLALFYFFFVGVGGWVPFSTFPFQCLQPPGQPDLAGLLPFVALAKATSHGRTPLATRFAYVFV